MEHKPGINKVVLKIFAPKSEKGKTYTINYKNVLTIQPTNPEDELSNPEGVGVTFDEIKDWKNVSYMQGNRKYHGEIIVHKPSQNKVVLKLFAPKPSIGKTFTIPYTRILRKQPTR